MNVRAPLGINVLLSLISSIVDAMLFVWPSLRTLPSEQALLWLVVPHVVRL